MKLKKFNEQLDDKSDIDPYGEERWNEPPEPTEDERREWRHTRGVCVHCGSYNLDWKGESLDDDTMTSSYSCMDCGGDGYEYYYIDFRENCEK